VIDFVDDVVGAVPAELRFDPQRLALLLAVPVAFFAMLEIELPWELLGYNAAIWLVAVLGTIVILGLGWEFHTGMVRQAKQGAANMDTLISLGTLSALGYSVWAMIAGRHHLYFETGAVIAALILLGRYFEARSRGQASAAIERLMDLGAKTAHVLRDGKELELAIEDKTDPPLLVAEPRLTFLWEEPMIFFARKKHCRDYHTWRSLQELLALLRGDGR
jgi:cation transport ATPase